MAKFSFPSCCFSCSCFSPSSSPQDETIASGPLPSSQPSQQPANSGPSTPPSSQPSQQPDNAGPSTTTLTDLESFLPTCNDISQLHKLIQFIEDRLNIESGEKNEGGSSPEVSSYIQDGQTILEFVDKHIGKLPQKKDSIDGVSAETEKVLISLLQGAGKIHWVGAALSVVRFVLARFNQMSSNKSECLDILKAMVNLGKQIEKLNEQIPEEKQKLNEAVEFIVEGCSMCASQLATTKIFRFLTASVNADSLKAFQPRIDHLYRDLTLSTVIDIGERVPKIASQSQKFYENEGAVGIESAQEAVIQLLDLSAQNISPQVVVVHGFGGIGKTTLADSVYAKIDLQSYKHCRIHMLQNCTENDLKEVQEQILKALFKEHVKLNNCDQGRGMIRSLSKENRNQPLFLYIDNGLKSTDLETLVPADLDSWLPPKSRMLVTTRNLGETDTFVSRNIQRQQYTVSPLQERESRDILLKKVSDYNDEERIDDLLRLCGGVPLLLELAGSQLAINSTSRNNIVLEMLRQGEKVKHKDISDRMVDFVYCRLSPPIQEAFLDITSFIYAYWRGKDIAYVVGEEEFKALEEASFVKTREDGLVIVHDIVRARGRKMSEGNRITDPESLSECLKDEEKLKNLKGIYLTEDYEQPPIEINENHLKCLSNSLRALTYENQLLFTNKCDKPFKQLRYLNIPRDIPYLPMEFEKLENISWYMGPFMQGMSLYELPPSLRVMYITNVISSENGVAYSKIPSKVTPPSSLVELYFDEIQNMERLPNGVEQLTNLEKLCVYECPKLKELPSKIGELTNLKILRLLTCPGLEELPNGVEKLTKLEELCVDNCPKLKELPFKIGELTNLKIYI